MAERVPNPAGSPLVAATLRAALGGAPAALSPRALDEATRLAERLAVYPLLHRALEAAGRAPTPRGAGLWREHTLRTLALRHHRRALDAQLGAAGVPALLLKGEPLAQAIFDDPFARNTTDIDLLIEPASVSRALRLLEAEGYRAAHPDPVRPWGSNQAALRHPRTRVVVEVHWSISAPTLPAPGFEALRADSVSIAGCEHLRAPGAHHTLFGLVLHFQQHHGALKTALDLAAWLDRCAPGAARARIEDEARALGLRGLFAWALGTLSRLTGLALPLPTPAPAPPAARLWAMLCARLLRGCLSGTRAPALTRLVMGEGTPGDELIGLVVQGLALTPLDGLRPLGVAWRPLLLGPHRLGRRVHALLSRAPAYAPERDPGWPR